MAIEPKSFFQFAAHNYSLLIDLYNCESDLNDEQIYNYIRKNINPDSPKPDYIFKQLISLKFIQPLPDASAWYEITHIVRHLLSFLEREHRFTSVKEIQAYVDDLEDLYSRLENSLHDAKPKKLFDILDEMSQHVERLRQVSNGNRLATIRAVKETKLNIQQDSTASRYEHILYIWERHIKPMEDLIEVDKPMDVKLTRCEQVLAHAASEFSLKKSIIFKINRVHLLIPRLRGELRRAFQESYDEIVPLLSELKANLFARGATAIIEGVEDKGAAFLDEIVDELSFAPTKLSHDIFNESYLEDFLKEVNEYKESPPPKIDFTPVDDTGSPAVLDFSEIFNLVNSSLPIDDTFEWILENFEDLQIDSILKVYNRVLTHASDFTFEQERKSYITNGFAVDVYPLTLKGLDIYE